MSLLKIKDPVKNNNEDRFNSAGHISIGIDFGTTNSMISLYLNGKVHFATESGKLVSINTNAEELNGKDVSNEIGKKLSSKFDISNFELIDNHQDVLIPSMVNISKDRQLTFGRKALLFAHDKDNITIKSIKRLIAIAFLSPEERELEIKKHFSDSNNLNYILKNEKELPSINAFGNNFSMFDITSGIFDFLKQVAIKSFSSLDIDTISSCVITVPARFGEQHRRFLKDAAESAGLSVKRIINEPTSAALAYNINPQVGVKEEQSGYYAIYDLGGGTFDTSIIHSDKGLLKVIANSGDAFLGGDDFDLILEQIIINKLNINSKATSEAHTSLIKEDLKHVVQNIKHKISNKEKECNFTYKGEGYLITNQEYNKAIQPSVKKTIDIFDNLINSTCLDEKGKNINDINNKYDKDNFLSGILLVGGSAKNGLILDMIKDSYNCPILNYISPEISVALGAGVQAAILDKRIKNKLLIDISPFSVGIETIGGLIEKVIHRNTTVPISVSETFTTSQDNQTAIEINIFQGERDLVKHSTLIGKFKLDKIPPMIASHPLVKVTFTLDADGILFVDATEERSGQNASITINPMYSLNFEKLKKDNIISKEQRREEVKERMYIQAISDSTVLLTHANRIISTIRENNEDNIENFQEAAEKVEKLQKAINSKGSFNEIVQLYQDIEQIMKPLLDRYTEINLKVK